MLRSLLLIVVVLCLAASAPGVYAQQTLLGGSNTYSLSVPDSMLETTEQGNDSEKIYYDNVSGVVMIITCRDGMFENTNSYMNCSRKNLEHELRDYQGDSSLVLISCETSKYYAKEAVVLHFETNQLPDGFNRCLIYFIHHGNKEIQFSFMYDKADKENLAYIDNIMHSLKLL